MADPDVEPRRCRRLALKKFFPASSEPSDPPPPPPKKRVLSNAERSKAFRERIKQDPESYQKYMTANKEKCRSYRQNLSEEKRAEQRAQARIRKQRERQRKREGQQEKRHTRTDDKAMETQRAEWREKKRTEAEKMHWRTREKKNERRRQLYREKKEAARANNTKAVQCEASIHTSAVGQLTHPLVFEGRSPEAQRKALQRARCAFPKSPRKFVSTVTSLIRKASPKKKQIFASTIDKLAPGVQQMGHLFMNACLRLRKKQLSADRQARRVLLSVCRGISSFKERSARLGVHWTTIKRHDLNKEEIVKKENAAEGQAKQFCEVSATVIPDKKMVSNKSGKAGAVLSQPIKDLYREFSSSGHQMSFSRFAKCRPANIRLMAHAKLRQCLCEYCMNLKLKLETLNSVAAVHNIKCWIRHERHAVQIITCDPKKKACCYGECSDCGLQMFDSHISTLLGHNGELIWYRWETRNLISKGKRISRKVLNTKKGDIHELVDELRSELQFVAEHLFRADWQLQKFSESKMGLPSPSQICMVMDFAENYACTYQDEIQEAHWHHDQVTVHPTVTYYRCPVCSERTTESLVFISPDKKHDHHAVNAFTTKAMAHLQRTRGLNISHVVQWTDGCASQYKSKGPFADISSFLTNFNATVERNFFGSRHGKSPSDGESAVIKHHVASAVKAKHVVISNALDMFKYLQSSKLNKQPPAEGCAHFLRSFFWVGQEDIKFHRDRLQDIRTIPGTRSFHSVRCTELNSIHSRHLTCLCVSCQDRVGRCLEEKVVGSWRCHNLKLQSQNQEKVCKLSLSVPEQGKPLQNAASSTPLSSRLNPQSVKKKAPLSPLLPTDPHSPCLPPSVITLPAISTLRDGISVQVVHHDHDTLPVEEDLVPSSSVETSPALSPVATPIGAPSSQPQNERPSPSPHLLESSHYFEGVLLSLQGMEDWSSLAIAAAEQEALLPPVTMRELQLRGVQVDHPSLVLYPSDGPNLTPIAIYGDGNCLPRCGSFLAWGTEERHLEMRTRIAVELITHRAHYLGETGDPAIGDLPRFCAQYSDHYKGEELSCEAITRIFEQEVRDDLKPGTYMGLWQLLALSSILQSPIHSVYPEYGGYTVRQQLHRVCTPRMQHGDGDKPLPGIMWTHTQGKNRPALTWRPNHFVVCLPFHNPSRARCHATGFDTKPGDFLLVAVPKDKTTIQCVAQITKKTADGDWGVYLKDAGNGKWKWPDTCTEFFIPRSDIKRVYKEADYSVCQEHRTVVYHFDTSLHV